MHKGDSNCAEIIEKTADALTNDTLRLLFVSVQQINIDGSIKFAVSQWVFISAGCFTLLIFWHGVNW
jgi:hypothetical protein